MKQFVCWIFVMCCLFPSAILAETSIPDFCMPILEAWGVTNEVELMNAILRDWEEKQPKGWKRLHKGAKTPVFI